MRDTNIRFRAAQAAQVVIDNRDLLNNVISVVHPKTDIREFQDAIRSFKFPNNIKVQKYDDAELEPTEITTRTLRYLDGVLGKFPRDSLTLLVDIVNVLPDMFFYFLHTACTHIDRIAKDKESLILSVERARDMKSTKFLSLYILARLDPQTLKKLKLKETPHVDVDAHVVVVDDMSYSGTQLYDDHELCKNVTFLLMGCTSQARERLTKKPGWEVISMNHIPVYKEFETLFEQDVLRYIDMGWPDNTGAGGLLFAPWKIPDALSTFDMFWKGYIYVGNLISNPHDFPEEIIDPNTLWVQFSPNPLFRDVDKTFYKSSPTLASVWDQAFTSYNAQMLQKLAEDESLQSPLSKVGRASDAKRQKVGESPIKYSTVTSGGKVFLYGTGINDERKIVARWYEAKPNLVAVAATLETLAELTGVAFVQQVTVDQLQVVDNETLMSDFHNSLKPFVGQGTTCVYSGDADMSKFGYKLVKANLWKRTL